VVNVAKLIRGSRRYCECPAALGSISELESRRVLAFSSPKGYGLAAGIHHDWHFYQCQFKRGPTVFQSRKDVVPGSGVARLEPAQVAWISRARIDARVTAACENLKVIVCTASDSGRYVERARKLEARLMLKRRDSKALEKFVAAISQFVADENPMAGEADELIKSQPVRLSYAGCLIASRTKASRHRFPDQLSGNAALKNLFPLSFCFFPTCACDCREFGFRPCAHASSGSCTGCGGRFCSPYNRVAENSI
jgi:hypothetical protein